MLQISIQRTQTVFRTITTLEIPTNGLRKKENITKGVCRENTHTESVRSQKIKAVRLWRFPDKDATFSQGQADEFTDQKVQKAFVSRKRTAGSYRRQRQDAEKAAV